MKFYLWCWQIENSADASRRKYLEVNQESVNFWGAGTASLRTFSTETEIEFFTIANGLKVNYVRGFSALFQSENGTDNNANKPGRTYDLMQAPNDSAVLVHHRQKYWDSIYPIY